MAEIELIATAAFGLEAVAAREIRALGYERTVVENGRVTFQADERAICRANLWLRSADRVLVKMGEFQALSFKELFEKTKALPWPDWIPENAAFPVQGKSINSKLFSVPDCQAIVKKAVVEKMKQRYRRQWFEETGSRYTIEVALLKDMATLTIDTSGAGLHKRGYRKLTGAAPLKETLAAAMLSLSRWKPDRMLIDPMCGSGTIPIEAALIGLNRAPGLRREFDAEKWPAVPARLWREARQEAEDAIRRERQLTIRGTDMDKDVLSLARYHARLAGVEDRIHWQQSPVAGLRARQKYGYIICNPPYGQRLEDLPTVSRLYREMGQVFQTLDTWSFYILTAHRDFEKLFGRRADKKRKLYNGRIQCNYYQFFGPRPPRRDSAAAREPGAEPDYMERRTIKDG
ncbi:MAG: Ribosomal RNA large subunit methyltransferase K [Pelotomaculum sp. PtaU1.Bin065]|nr:MAG: Ribosomal RNA large subunit methyltransferase K [Pelotomaculum sp. PtaU1.Bin065]